MNNKPYYTLETEIGSVFAVPTSGREVNITTHPRGLHLRRGGCLTVRNIGYNVSMRARWNGDKIDGIVIAEDGKTEMFVSSKGNDGEWKIKSINIARINPVGRELVSRHAAIMIYDAVIEAMNIFYANNKARVDADWQALESQREIPQAQAVVNGSSATVATAPKPEEKKQESVEAPAPPTTMQSLLKEQSRLYKRLEEVESQISLERKARSSEANPVPAVA